MTAIVGVHGVGNYVPGQPAEKVAARRSADWAASVAAGLGIRPGCPGPDRRLLRSAPARRAAHCPGRSR